MALMLLTNTSVLTPSETFSALVHSTRGQVLIVAVVLLSALYPKFGFIRRQEIGSLRKNREQILNAFVSEGFKPVRESEHEMGCDALILVTAPYETSVARICARDGIAPEMARRRLDAQTPLETLRAAATAELVNDSTPDALREKLRSVLNGLEKEGTCQKPKSEKEAF